MSRRLSLSPPDTKRERADAHLLGESSQFSVLVGDGHALQIAMVPDGLEVATYKEKVDLVAVLPFEGRDVGVYRVELAMAAPLYSDLHTSDRAW